MGWSASDERSQTEFSISIEPLLERTAVCRSEPGLVM
jgi:hypothetical protein